MSSAQVSRALLLGAPVRFPCIAGEIPLIGRAAGMTDSFQLRARGPESAFWHRYPFPAFIALLAN
jgi:hypothetical protein